jgi:transposase
MPKLSFARAPLNEKEEQQIRKLAGSRQAPGDWIVRAKMIVDSWERKRTTAIARDLGCHPQTVRERISHFNEEGLDGLGDRPGAGRRPRLTEHERGVIIVLARSVPPNGPRRIRSVPARAGPRLARRPKRQWTATAARQLTVNLSPRHPRQDLMRLVFLAVANPCATVRNPSCEPDTHSSSALAPTLG